MIIIGGLENFVPNDFEKECEEAIKLKVVHEQVMEKGKNDPVDRIKIFSTIVLTNVWNNSLKIKSRKAVDAI